MDEIDNSDIDAVAIDLRRNAVRISKKSRLSGSFSRSTPSLSASVPTLATRSSSTRSLSMPTSSSGEKKFHRYFRQVPSEERVLSYYRCALARDILFQGHLYITPNYFGFYSKVLGYETKLLIPMTSVVDISKQMTVKIIPNAIAITTEKNKHVFCSLFWKDSVFKSMQQVWNDSRKTTSVTDIGLPFDEEILPSEDPLVDSSEGNLEEDDSGSKSESDETSSSKSTTEINPDGLSPSISRPVATMTRAHTMNAILIALLAALCVSAALMMIRIDGLHRAYLNRHLDSPGRCSEDHLLHHIDLNLDRIVRMRQTLQTMSEHFMSITGDAKLGYIPDGVPDLENTPG